MKIHRGGWIVVVLCVGILAACAKAPQPAAPTSAPTEAAVEPRALLNTRGSMFSSVGQCAACHTGLKTADGTDISIDTDWRSTMMANAARDPYYRASVRRETLIAPEYNDFIQNKCSTCHVPMSHFTSAAAGGTTIMFDDGVFAAANPDHTLAMDGVSCTVCHQIQDEKLGTMDSYSGGLVFDAKTPAGERTLFGQFDVAENWVAVMKAASGYAPLKSAHTEQAALCATCHNLFTPYITNDGKVSVDLFPEQTPYTEWEHSSYGDGVSCQACHMPDAGEAVAISTVNPEKRTPFRQHTFVGANQFMLGLLKTNGDLLEVTALDDQFDQTHKLTEQQLAEKTAALTVTPGVKGSTLNLDVKISVQTGHKFPTSFPSRRAWLHVVVKDAGGAVVFESGGWDENGAISGNANDQDAASYEPHYLTIDAPDQVQIYETIIGNPDGKVTTTLLRAQHYLKDNRLLPDGMDKTAIPPEIAVAGEAAQDADFTGGGDTVRYVVQLPTSGPYQVMVELLYQPIGYRWAENLGDTPGNAEAESFLAMLKQTPLTPALVARTNVETGKP